MFTNRGVVTDIHILHHGDEEEIEMSNTAASVDKQTTPVEVLVKTDRHTDKLKANHASSTINPRPDVQPMPLDTPNTRTTWEKAQVLTFGTLFRLLVDTVSIPVLLALDKDRLKLTVNTGKTGSCRLLVYIPKESDEKPKGVLMHLHGGGWTISRPETESPICRYLADNIGTIVVAPDYCKAPRYPHPWALEQSHAVLSWIASGGLSEALTKSSHLKASSLKVDATRIALSGGSAGSNLACSLTALCITRPLPECAQIVAQALLYPALNLAVPYEEKIARVDPARILPQWASRFFLRAYLPPPRSAADPFVSPALVDDEVIRQFPSTVILTAAYDYLAHEAEEFANRLRSEGVQVTNRRFDDVGHGFDGIPTRDHHQRMLNHEARDIAWGMIAVVFRQALL